MYEANLPQGYQDNEQNVIAHMSPSEIDELLRIQGRNEIDPHTGFHSFAPLGEYISHQQVSPHIDSFIQNYRGQPRANAGLSRYIEDSGQHGDTKAVVLPRVLANLFDNALNNGRPMINPKTGKRQYFLGALLGGLGSILSPLTGAISGMLPGIGGALSSAASSILPSLGSAASSILPTLGKAASSILPQIGNMASSVLPQLGNMAGQGLQQLAPHLGNMAAQGISSMAQRYGGNMGGQLAGALSPAINSAVSGIASGLGQQLGGGQGNYGQTMQNAGSQAFSAMKPMAQQYAGQAMQGLANKFMPSGAPGGAAAEGGAGMSSMMDALPELAELAV